MPISRAQKSQSTEAEVCVIHEKEGLTKLHCLSVEYYCFQAAMECVCQKQLAMGQFLLP